MSEKPDAAEVTPDERDVNVTQFGRDQPRETLLGKAQVRAVLEQEELGLGGRFARLVPTVVVGAAPMPSYPGLPKASPWHSDPVGPEEPLGFSVDELPDMTKVQR
jgi:hypothetical protein